jgi:site-specific DNA-methyltransferase (adenine-specific)
VTAPCIEQLGEGVTLYLGDCREILPTLPKVDAVVTDPPYGVELKEKTSRYSTRLPGNVYQDDEETILPLVRDVIAASQRIAARVVVTPGTRLLQAYPRAQSIGTIFSPGCAGRDSWGFGCNNPVLFYGKCPYLAAGKGSRPNSFGSYRANPYGKDEDDNEHPCPKPLKWMLWLVARATNEPSQTVCDPFMGSGTTGVAAVKTRP